MEAPGGSDRLRVAIKDLIDMAGLVTTAGSRAVAAAARPAPSDAGCLAGIRRAEAAGAVAVVGKTNLHELAFGITGVNPWYGTPVNPWNAARVPGGSSSGSAVAVAVGGEADVALGTDTGGSIRIPAACCAVAGLKTTRGRLPLDGIRPLAPSLDTVGPMGATVGAVATGMALLEPGFRPAPAGARRVGRFRIRADPEVDGPLDRALARYAEISGATITDIDLPGWAEATVAAMTVLSAEAWGTNRALFERSASQLSPEVADRLEASRRIGAADVASAGRAARVWDLELRSCFSQCDVIAMPVLAAEPPPLPEAARMADLRLTAPWNLAGLPALAMPVPPGPDGGWPPSLQLIGQVGAEELLVATGLSIEGAAL